MNEDNKLILELAKSLVDIPQGHSTAKKTISLIEDGLKFQETETDALRQRNEELESKLTGCENRYQRQNGVIQRLNEQVEKLEGQLDEAKDTVEWVGRKEDTANKRVAELEAELAGWNPDDTKPYSVAFSRLLKVDSRHYVYDTKTRQAIKYYSNPYHAKAEAKRLNDIKGQADE